MLLSWPDRFDCYRYFSFIEMLTHPTIMLPFSPLTIKVTQQAA